MLDVAFSYCIRSPIKLQDRILDVDLGGRGLSATVTLVLLARDSPRGGRRARTLEIVRD